MPKATVAEASNYPIPEDTLCPAELRNVTLYETPFTYKTGKRAGQQGIFKKWEWEFYINSGEYEGLTVKGNSEPGLTNADMPAGTLKLARPWFETLLGRELVVGEEADTDTLIGLPCQITVSHQEPRPREKGDGFWFNVEVEDVFPLSPSAQSEPPF